MNILSSLTAPKLHTVLFSMTNSWILVSLLIYSGYEKDFVNILTFLSIWALLFAGLLAKVKGFKIANGVFSVGFLIMIMIGIFNLVITSLEINTVNSIEYSKIIFYFLFSILVFISSGYVTYATLINRNFKLLYLNKDDVSDKVKTIWKSVAIIIISIMLFITLSDIGYI